MLSPRWKRPLPSPLGALGDHDTPPRQCVVGEGAWFALGGQRPRLTPELLVERSLDALLAAPEISPCPDLPGAAVGYGWRLIPAPEGLEAGLRARRVPVDAVGVTPEGEVLDPLDGVMALADGELGVRDPEALVSEEPGALMSMLGACALLGARPDPALIAVMKATPESTLRPARAALRHDLTRILVGRSVGPVLESMSRGPVMSFVLPEVASMRDFHRSSRFHHKDVWAHTRQVVEQAVPRPMIRWAALLHDIGKIHTRGYGPGKKVHFLRHDEVGAYMFEGVAARLAFPEEMAARLRTLIFYHLRPGLFDLKASDAAVRRFVGEVGPAMTDLLLLSRADVTSKRPGRRREAMFHLSGLQARIIEVARKDAERVLHIPKGLGTAIIKDLGVKPGPQVGALRQICEQAVRRGQVPANSDIPVFIDFLRRQGVA